VKRVTCALLSTLILCMIAVPAFANSAPSYWEAYPYSEVLAVDKDSPVIVEKEYLTYDFSGDLEYGNHFSPVARVTAGYQMKNPTDDRLSVQMAFPFVTSLADISFDHIQISVDNAAVPYEIYIDTREAEIGPSGEDFAYDITASDIRKDEIVLTGFDVDAGATLYRFAVSAERDHPVDFKLAFHIDPDKTILIAKGFSGSTVYENGGADLFTRIEDSREMEILVWGEDSEFTYGVYTEDGTAASAETYTCDISSSVVQPKDYLVSLMDSELGVEHSSAIPPTQLLNLCLSKIWRASRDNGFVTVEDTLSSLCYTDRVITLVYTIDFPAAANRNVSVSYLSGGVMDRRETVKSKYSYTYLLSPAKNWAQFRDLNIKILTPEEAPYIIESSLPLTAEGENTYTAAFNELPENELNFTLYGKEKVTDWDRLRKKIHQMSYILFFIWPFVIILLAVIVFFIFRSIIRRKRRGPGSPL